MIAVAHSDPKWLQALLNRAIDEHWCTQINCTTCGSHQLREALGVVTSDDAKLTIDGLRECAPPSADVLAFEEAVRWILYEIWRRFGERFDNDLNATYAGQVLARMQEHHARRTNARRIHEQRQGVKQRDRKE